MNFADRMIAACNEKNSRLVVGLDPHWHLIPESFKDEMDGASPGDVVAAFLIRAVEVTVAHAAAYKPQIAFFEQFGTPGMLALEKVLTRIRELGGTVIMDAKRGDIGSTATAYARAFFGDDRFPPAWPSDALTVNGYLGSDGILPFLKNNANGIFVLVKTSNPSSGELQDLSLQSQETVAASMASLVNGWNEGSVGDSGYGNVGAVIGATYPDHMRALRGKMPQSLILVPGYGAQGGAEEAVSAAFNKDTLGALINSSRGILFPSRYEQDGFAAIEEAAETARLDIQRLAGVQ